MSKGLGALFGDPQKEAADQAVAAAQQQDAFTEQLYQQAQQDRQNQEAQLRGAIGNLAQLGNPFATAAGSMHPDFMSPSTGAATFQGGNIPSVQAPQPPQPMTPGPPVPNPDFPINRRPPTPPQPQPVPPMGKPPMRRYGPQPL